MDSKLLEILVCPDSKQSLHLADNELVQIINKKISDKSLNNKVGDVVIDTIDEALVTEDGKILYCVRSDIPVMLIDEAIELSQLDK